MTLLKIPHWLRKRPICKDDIPKLKILFPVIENTTFQELSVDNIKEFYSQNSRSDFFKLIRVLGLYGVVFDGKLKSFSGPYEKDPLVLWVPKSLWYLNIAKQVSNQNLISIFQSCGFEILKQLHGIPIKSINKLTEDNYSEDNISTLMRDISLELVSEDFFKDYSFDEDTLIEPANTINEAAEIFKTIDEQMALPIEKLTLSLRASHCLKNAKVCNIGDLVKKPEQEVSSIPALGKKSLNEIKERLSRIGLRLGMENQKSVNTDLTHQRDIKISDSVDKLNLSVRSSNCLGKANINYISDLINKSDKELLAISQLGNNSLVEIKSKLYNHFPELKYSLRTKPISECLLDKIDIESEEVLIKLNTQIEDLVLSNRTRNCLEKLEINFIWQLIQKTKSELFEVRNFGRKSFKELKEIIQNLGFNFGIHWTPDQIEKIQSFEKIIDKSELSKNFKRIVNGLIKDPLDFLNSYQKMIVSERTWKVGRKKTLEEIATDLGITRERVRQLEVTLCNKIKQRYRKELRQTIGYLKRETEKRGGLLNFAEINMGLSDFSPQEQAILSSLVNLSENRIHIDWEFNQISMHGEDWFLNIFDGISAEIQNQSRNRFFSKDQLIKAAEKLLEKHNIFDVQCRKVLIEKFCQNKRVIESDDLLYFGRILKSDKIAIAFKEIFPKGIEIYKKQDLIFQKLKSFDPMMFQEASHRSVIGLLTNHPDILLWNRGFCIHRDKTDVDMDLVQRVSDWILSKFDKGISRFQINLAYTKFEESLINGGIPNQYALYTLIRLLNIKRIGLPKYPTIIDIEADSDLNVGILEELENYFYEKKVAVKYSKVKEEFINNRGWKEYSLQQNITSHSDFIIPWQDHSYIHLEYLKVNYDLLDKFIDALRKKLKAINGAYSLKGAKKDMNVMWEQVCPNASVRTMIKLIRLTDQNDIVIDRYFVKLNEEDTESISATMELEEYFLDENIERSKFEINEEFCGKRGWSENQIYWAIRKANLFKSGKNTYIHPSTINWSQFLGNEVHNVLEKFLLSRNKSGEPHMQIDELIYQFVLPELTNDIQWTRYLIQDIGEELGNFLFFDDAYTFIDNDFGIEDLDDMIAFLIHRHFEFGIAKKGKVEEMLWREGILENGHLIPSSQFFEESSILYHPDSNEVGLSLIGVEKYGRSN